MDLSFDRLFSGLVFGYIVVSLARFVVSRAVILRSHHFDLWSQYRHHACLGEGMPGWQG